MELARKIAEAKRVLQKFPDRIPIIVTPKREHELMLDNSKFLVPLYLQKNTDEEESMTVGHFMAVLRKRINLGAEQALFMFTSQNTLLPVSTTLAEAYAQYKAEDLFLYLTVTTEETFGYAVFKTL